jgi:beta-phosphoglucomutase-like phosphatase (HAD superfamily)
LTIYDGLSTNQKLTLLMQLKDMPVEHSPAIWKRKQELTLEFVKLLVKPTEHITNAIKQLKRRGFPVACASNCIRQSVVSLLQAIGVLPDIDVYVSNEDVVRAKPEADIYLKTCDAFKVCVLHSRHSVAVAL